MSRINLALGLVVIAAAAILIAVAIVNPTARSRAMNDPGRKTMESAPSGASIASGEKKPPAQTSDSDAVLKSFSNSNRESNRSESNSPRMQQKQIKMH